MSRALVLGNGTILVNLDRFGQVRDYYFPHVGLENHIGGELAHRVGVFVDGQLSWTSAGDWRVTVSCESETFAAVTEAVNDRLGVMLLINDIVYNEKNILVRHVTVRNLADQEREIKVFFYQQFEPYQSHIAHTAYFDPESESMIHYRNKRVFLASGQLEGRFFDDYTTGVFGVQNREGSYRDAEDGRLTKNPIEHGQADSVLGFTARYPTGETKTIYYWLLVARSVHQALELHHYLLDKGPAHLLETTKNFWRAWVNRYGFNFHGLNEETIKLFKKSLFFLRAHADSAGGIIASGDSSPLHQGKDTYNYIWPRDAAYAAIALSRAGDVGVAKNFFSFCQATISQEGYFLHKYGPDKSRGSSWHPLIKDGVRRLPIQEDETALVIWSLWHYYEVTKDLEFIELIYNSLVRPAADFMVLYREEANGLPKSSYDLWEEKYGSHTFTAAAVAGALRVASRFAYLLGKVKSGSVYDRAADEIKEGIMRHLHDDHVKVFLKMLGDSTIDMSSFYAMYGFGLLPVTDGTVRAMAEVVERELKVKNLGGVARYKGDNYCRVTPDAPGNPWFVTTLWLAQYYVRIAKSEKDLDIVKEYLNWAVRHSQPSGALSEQLNPVTGEQLSVSPLNWSHAEFVITVLDYLNKLKELGICEVCNPV
ncbi:MAG: glycoside hydrolase family 15 protein [Candidatus Vogelbacteria bacterium]|nr:glycoside hydrolase family 15 protein [Candidatus Vogelbacteria bacterium]